MYRLYFHKDLNLETWSHVGLDKGDSSVRATITHLMMRHSSIMNRLLFFFHPQVLKNLIFHQMIKKNSSSQVSLKKCLNKSWLLLRPSTRLKKTHCRLKFKFSKPYLKGWRLKSGTYRSTSLTETKFRFNSLNIGTLMKNSKKIISL